MPNSKICPIVLTNYSSNMNSDEYFEITNLQQDGYGSCSNRYGGDYWHPRRVFTDSHGFDYGCKLQSDRNGDDYRHARITALSKSYDFSRSNRYGSDYMHSRRVFLNSYKFSDQYGFKDNFKRSIKELNDATVGAALGIWKEGSKKVLGIRVFRFPRVLRSSLLSNVGCFAPLSNKKKEDGEVADILL